MGSGGTGPGERGRGSRGGADVWVGTCRLCSPVPGSSSEAADLGPRKEAGSLLSAEADHGTSPPAEMIWLPAVNQLRSAASL